MRPSSVSAVLAGFLLVSSVHGAFVEYNFTVTHGFWAPDCVTKMIYLVNGAYPGPAINITSGDTVSVTVNNRLYAEGVTIHWHGIFQTGTPFYDGVGMGSQCPILPGESFTYTFTVEQVGTFWWHSHFSLQKANGLYGLLVVRPKPTDHPEPALLAYDEELEPMLLNDWWHTNNVVQELGLVGQQLPAPFIWVGDPLSLLINGHGVYNCSNTDGLNCLTCNSSSPFCGYPVFEVEQGKRYRVRLVNVAALTYISFALEGHNVTVVQADGTYTQAVSFENLDINAGQSYSVVFTADRPVDNYWITTHVRHRAAGPTGAAILRYKGAPAAYPARDIPSTFPAWNDTAYSIAQQRKILTRTGYTETVPSADREIILVGTQNRVNGYLRWAVNNQSYVPPGTPPLLEQYYGLNPIVDTGAYDRPQVTWNYTNPLLAEGISTSANFKSITYNIPLNTVVQVVFQNTLALNNVSEQHPWHLHGHDFWVLGWGNGVYNPVTDPASFNLVNPIKRNTATLYPKGWLVIRYVADNPGIWPFHCHIVYHLVLGMQVSFAEGLDQLPPLPANFPTCGSITSDIIKAGFPSSPPPRPPPSPRRGGKHPPGVGHHPPGKGGHKKFGG